MATIVTLTMNPALDIATSTDCVEPTHKLRCSVPRYDPGGGGINVARAVHAPYDKSTPGSSSNFSVGCGSSGSGLHS